MAVPRRLVLGLSALCVAAAWLGFEFYSDAAGTFLPGHIRQASKAALKRPNRAAESQDYQVGSVNPLASLALDSFKETVERPLFNQTRAPKPAPVIAEDEPQDEPQEPQSGPGDFTLLGVVVSDTGKTALVRLNKTNEVLRLKDGQELSDWQVTEIGPKSIVIKKDDQEFPLQLFGSRAPNAVAQPADDGDDSGDDQESDNQAEAVSRLERPVAQHLQPRR